MPCHSLSGLGLRLSLRLRSCSSSSTSAGVSFAPICFTPRSPATQSRVIIILLVAAAVCGVPSYGLRSSPARSVYLRLLISLLISRLEQARAASRGERDAREATGHEKSAIRSAKRALWRCVGSCARVCVCNSKREHRTSLLTRLNTLNILVSDRRCHEKRITELRLPLARLRKMCQARCAGLSRSDYLNIACATCQGELMLIRNL